MIEVLGIQSCQLVETAEMGIESLTIAFRGERRPALGYCVMKRTLLYGFASHVAFNSDDDHDIGLQISNLMRGDACGQLQA